MTRTTLAVSTLLLTWLVGAAPQGLAQSTADDVLRYRMYIGTYTRGESEGVYVCDLDAETGRLSPPRLAAVIDNPSFLAVHPKQARLYAVGEISNFGGKRAGAVSGFRIKADGRLTLLNQKSSGGAGPCHVVVDPTGQAVVVANYGGGSTSSFPLEDDGLLGDAASFFQHEGASVHPKRQQGPHAHGICIDDDGTLAAVADLGLDKVLLYRLDADSATLAPGKPNAVSLSPGSGPRHVMFHPRLPVLYTINELASTITCHHRDADSGRLTLKQTIATLPDSFTGTNTTAELQISPDGRFLYGSNRGHDSIATFAVDQQSGVLALVGHVKTGGETPRNFNLDPTGRWMFVANQKSDNIVAFRVDPKRGLPAPTGREIAVASPVCLVFVAQADDDDNND